MIKIHCGKNIDILKTYPENHFHSVVTDPPYGLGKEPNIVKVMGDWVKQGYHEVANKGGFMNKTWDKFVPQPLFWKEVYRVLRPGGYMLVACGTRTQDWMVSSIRFAGFEIRDVISWHYGSGFPKSLNVSKEIDKLLGKFDEREIIGKATSGAMQNANGQNSRPWHEANKNEDGKIEFNITSSATAEAQQWNGYGTALKPATEFWTLCRKPIEGTVAQNTLKWGTGLNIDGCRIEFESDEDFENAQWGRGTDILGGNYVGSTHSSGKTNIEANPDGRFPANVIFDEHTAAILDEQSGELKSGALSAEQQKNGGWAGTINCYGTAERGGENEYEASTGGASRFFYCAKPSKSERNKGLEGFDELVTNDGQPLTRENPFQRGETLRQNTHPTVKPVSLMRYLVRLVTPKGGICLDPFSGSGTTGIGLKMENLDGVLIDQEQKYCAIAQSRIDAWEPEPIGGPRKKKVEEFNDPAQFKMQFPE